MSLLPLLCWLSRWGRTGGGGRRLRRGGKAEGRREWVGLPGRPASRGGREAAPARRLEEEQAEPMAGGGAEERAEPVATGGAEERAEPVAAGEHLLSPPLQPRPAPVSVASPPLPASPLSG